MATITFSLCVFHFILTFNRFLATVARKSLPTRRFAGLSRWLSVSLWDVLRQPLFEGNLEHAAHGVNRVALCCRLGLSPTLTSWQVCGIMVP